MGDERALVARVISTLEDMAVPYMIGGSVALSVWAVPRMTHDLYIVVDMPEDRILEFCSRFPAEQYYIDPDILFAGCLPRLLRHD